MKGKKITLEEPDREPADAQVIDLMSRLQESLKQGGNRKGSVRAKSKVAAAHAKTPTRGSKRARRKTA
jgi:hypothetical protein